MKQRNRFTQRRLQLRPIALSLICAGAAPAMAQVLPTGFNSIAGGVTMTQSGSVMSINQPMMRGIANWQTFSIGAGGTVNIAQPSTRAVLLNRVVGDGVTIQASRIDGALRTSLIGNPNLPGGSVFLINPSGIVFGNGSSVNVGGLVASTLDIANSNFMPAGSENKAFDKSEQLVFVGPANSVAQVRLEQGASITASPGGTVALVGGSVRNDGEINVARGSVGLVSASKLSMNLDFDGDGLTTFKVPLDGQTTFKLADLQATDKTTTAQLMNTSTGKVTADGGRVVLMAAAADVDARQLVVSQTGVIRARSLSTRNGEIVLDGGQSSARSNEMLLGGTIDATGSEAGVAGGSITASADYVRLSGLTADASGSKGGSIQVTGNAAVSMSPDSALRANATGENGQGGTVSLSADYTHVSGQIQARGAGSGAGGTITTTARQVEVTELAQIDAAGGASGANGTWVVESKGTLNVDNTVPAYDPNDYGLNTADTRVSSTAIGNALGRSTDVKLRTGSNDGESNDVVFQDNASIVKSEGRDARLTVDSLRDIRMGSGSSIRSESGALHVDFDANSNSGKNGGVIELDNASIATNGGNIRFYGQGDPVNGYAVGGIAPTDGGPNVGRAGISLFDSSLNTCAMASGNCGGSGSITLRGQGTSTSAGDPSYYVSSDGVQVSGSSLTTGAGNISITGAGGIGAGGVLMDSTESNDTVLRTGTGDVSITGSSRSWTATDPVAVYGGTVDFVDSSFPDVTTSNIGGISMRGATIDAGGRVAIDGTGSDMQGLTANSAFLTSASAANGGAGVTYAAGNGVTIFGGSITAGKGRDISISGTAGGKGFDVANGTATIGGDASAVALAMEAGGTVRAEGGRIAIDGRGGDVRVGRVNVRDVPSGTVFLPVLDVSSSTGAGGTVSLAGRNVLVLDSFDNVTTIDAGGAGQSGTIDVRATGTIAISDQASLRADAKSATGNGGTINVIAGDTLRGYGSLSARGGASGGNGGNIETSAPHFDLTGLRVDASAPMGTAGKWTIDPYNVNIAHGTASGSLTGNPFDPLANSTIQDGDINNALDGGTSVTITTGTGGVATDGNITFAADAAIVRSKGATPLTFELDAAHNINAFSNNSIQSNSGALNVVFNAGVGGQNGSIFLSGAKIATNGGNVTMTADTSPTGNQAVSITNTTIDTRTTALGDAGPGGSVQITGKRGMPTFSGFTATVQLSGATIQSSTGDVSITGTAPGGTGVRIGAGTGPSQILTTSGDISIVGIGSGVTDPSTGPLAVQAVDLSNVTVRSVDGNIGIRGLVTPGPMSSTSGGVLIANNALVTTLGAGDIDVAGESQANGTGVTLGTGGRIDGNRNVVLRASNDGSTDALVLTGTVRAGNVLDLRPGGVDAAGNAVDRTGSTITLGGTAATGFAVSAAEFSRLDAPTIVAGSNAHAGNISVVGPLTVPGALTLQNGAGGGIQLGSALTASTIGLISAGNITQTASAPITAGTLLARSTGGSVLLDQAANNVSADTVGGGAAGAFRYVDVDTVKLGSVSVTGYDAAGNAPQVVSATSMAADTVFVRTLSGDLLLGTNVSSTNGVDLVAASRFQNTGGYTIAGAPWRVWADTWVGETRGGLAGSGLYPNLYHCAYSGLCAVSIPAGANHFIYAQQPVATVLIANATRPFGYPNPLFSYLVTGLILGDTGAGFAGFMFSPALQPSPPGVYPINGAFTSAEGYRVNVVPGNLFVGGVPNLPRPDALRDLPATWVYDRNIGPPPICFATGPLEGDRATQGGDVLAREWSRVRSRPNLSSCVDTEKRNGCADF
ncbi:MULTISPECIES: filamentous hemagglutinin N-terminal domain-containing protein [unclassified Variovorax]|jgi:filamentous hemagglutinin family protein|uniref:two-partner secretion domain-containing protein n=1 Tax=unclassified Variovorax TaxID=663243 RepID=UPI000F7E9FF0|nr:MULTISPECIES: filamentous hemagglutinin N-terminal domain-containing protein [unclassified Variovorax]RSZ42686.1 filamentous hemagglutinin N-terminal domain-containing protein [Variovorax sp. 553]RSZ43660.1 filamentous hemagglutinin N-terminal domain-containing protein [Variovorax sp. 679]